jgi:hypothetical protein
VGFIIHLDADRAYAIDERPADRVGGNRFGQDHEAPGVRCLRDAPVQNHPALERVEVLRRGEHRAGDTQHVEPTAISAALIADGDETRRLGGALALPRGAVLPALLFQGNVNERVERVAGMTSGSPERTLFSGPAMR